jgi:hypothetical protein
MVDLQLDRDESSTWPDGILFEHMDTKQRLTYLKGILTDENGVEITTKRIRTRRSNKTILIPSDNSP